MGDDTWCGPKDGIGLTLVFGAMAGTGLVDMVANFDIVCKLDVGYNLGQKSLFTMSFLSRSTKRG